MPNKIGRFAVHQMLTIISSGRPQFIKFNFQELANFLDQRNLPKVIWVSEDATRISSKIEYNSNTNKVMGFSLPLENGVPNNNAFLATSAKAIANYFETSSRADYAYTIMAQPLSPISPSFCLTVFATDNKFKAQDVTARWKHIAQEAEKFGIQILGYSSDGDPRLMKSMKMEAHFVNEPEMYDWYHIDINSNPFCFIQDPIHITKLKSRF